MENDSGYILAQNVRKNDIILNSNRVPVSTIKNGLQDIQLSGYDVYDVNFHGGFDYLRTDAPVGSYICIWTTPSEADYEILLTQITNHTSVIVFLRSVDLGNELIGPVTSKIHIGDGDYEGKLKFIYADNCIFTFEQGGSGIEGVLFDSCKARFEGEDVGDENDLIDCTFNDCTIEIANTTTLSFTAFATNDNCYFKADTTVEDIILTIEILLENTGKWFTNAMFEDFNGTRWLKFVGDVLRSYNFDPIKLKNCNINLDDVKCTIPCDFQTEGLGQLIQSAETIGITIIGAAGFTDGEAENLQFGVGFMVPVVAYKDVANSDILAVKYYNTVTPAWEDVPFITGEPVSDGAVGCVALDIMREDI
jgi:hypothetical protein